MSFTAAYSPLFDAERYEHADDSFAYWSTSKDSIGHGVVVRDPDGLEGAIKETIHDDADFGETKRGDYPKQVYKKLYGFKTWEFDYYNIERLGFGYDWEAACRFWSTVSRYTDPFVFYTPEVEGDFPDVVDVVEDRNTTVYRVTADDGDLKIERIRFSSRVEVDDVEHYQGGES